MDLRHAASDHRGVDSFSILPLSARGANAERVRLRFSFQAVTLPQAAAVAVELRAMAASTPRIRAVPAQPVGSRCWIITATTLPLPLTLSALRRWEQELLTIERRCSGSRFLGWRIAATPADGGPLAVEGASAAREAPPPGEGGSPPAGGQVSQRQLVIASLVRHPTAMYAGGLPRGAVRR